MQVDRDEIEASLPKKGFVKDDRKKGHRYFYHEYKGKRTGPFAYTSHGSGYKVYGDPLLKRMKAELRLDTVRQVADLVECPMTQDAYEAILKGKGIIKDESSSDKK